MLEKILIDYYKVAQLIAQRKISTHWCLVHYRSSISYHCRNDAGKESGRVLHEGTIIQNPNIIYLYT